MKQEATYVGGWVARHSCDDLHPIALENIEGIGGYRGMGRGHEHFEFIPSAFGKDGASPSLTIVDEASDPFGRISEDRGSYTAVLDISTNSGPFASMELSVRGSARVVSLIIGAAADVFKEEAER